MGNKEYGLDLHEVERIADEIADLHEHGVEIAIGGGTTYCVTQSVDPIDSSATGRGPLKTLDSHSG